MIKKFLIGLLAVYVLVDQGSGKPKSPQSFTGMSEAEVKVMMKKRGVKVSCVSRGRYEDQIKLCQKDLGEKIEKGGSK